MAPFQFYKFENDYTLEIDCGGDMSRLYYFYKIIMDSIPECFMVNKKKLHMIKASENGVNRLHEILKEIEREYKRIQESKLVVCFDMGLSKDISQVVFDMAYSDSREVMKSALDVYFHMKTKNVKRALF